MFVSCVFFLIFSVYTPTYSIYFFVSGFSKAATKEADSVPVLTVSDTQSFYVSSLSSRTIVYKGQLSPEQVGLPAFCQRSFSDRILASKPLRTAPSLPGTNMLDVGEGSLLVQSDLQFAWVIFSTYARALDPEIG